MPYDAKRKREFRRGRWKKSKTKYEREVVEQTWMKVGIYVFC